MPAELRRIILSEDEVKHALASYRRAEPATGLPNGTLIKAAPQKDGSLYATYACDETPEVSGISNLTDVTLSRDACTNMLIRFCLENNIPVPKAGAKRAIKHAGYVALEIVIAATDGQKFTAV